MTPETIAYIPRQQALAAGITEGWTPTSDVDRAALLADLQWGSRAVLDDPESPDPSRLQLVSYVVIMRGDEVFLTQRLEGGGESRLHGKVSAGVGGHVEAGDLRGGLLPGLSPTIGAAAYRELSEEVEVSLGAKAARQGIVPTGYIYDPSTPVGSVHLGCVYTLQVDDCNVREVDTLRGFWGDVMNMRSGLFVGHDLDDMQGEVDLESWARIALEKIDQLRDAA